MNHFHDFLADLFSGLVDSWVGFQTFLSATALNFVSSAVKQQDFCLWYHSNLKSLKLKALCEKLRYFERVGLTELLFEQDFRYFRIFVSDPKLGTCSLTYTVYHMIIAVCHNRFIKLYKTSFMKQKAP